MTKTLLDERIFLLAYHLRTSNLTCSKHYSNRKTHVQVVDEIIVCVDLWISVDGVLLLEHCYSHMLLLSR